MSRSNCQGVKFLGGQMPTASPTVLVSSVKGAVSKKHVEAQEEEEEEVALAAVSGLQPSGPLEYLNFIP